jgi:hypothetical protein
MKRNLLFAHTIFRVFQQKQSFVQKTFLFLSLFLICLLHFSYASMITSSAAGGNWNSTASWNGGVIPGLNDSAVISNGNITVTANQAVGSVTIASGKILTIGAFTLTVAQSPAGTGGTVGGYFTNNGGTLTSNTGATVSMGTGGVIGGTTATSFKFLTINTTSSTDTVKLAISGVTVQNNSDGGTLTLTNGIFKIGAANTLIMNGNQKTITASTTGRFDTTGNGTNGGTLSNVSQNNIILTASSSNPLRFYNFLNGGNLDINITNASSVVIDGTFTIANNQRTWAGTGATGTNGLIYGNYPTSTLYVKSFGAQSYNPTTAEWIAMTSGTLGTTQGYPNNVILVNIASGANLTGDRAIAGTLSAGDGTTAGSVDISGTTSFLCGGITINTLSTLKARSTVTTVKGNWLRTGTGTTFTPNGGTIQFGGTGTCSAPNTISSPTSGSETFNSLSVINGAYVSLSSPVTIGTSGVLTLTSGIITTTATNLLSITNTATAAITGGTSSSFINGPIKWSLASGTNIYIFPMGVATCPSTTTYLPFTLNSKNSTGSNTATVQAFTGTPSGGTGLANGSTTEYWSLSTSSGLGTTGSTVSVTRPSAIAAGSVIGESATLGGNYTSFGGTVSGTGPASINVSNDIGTTSPWFFVIGSVVSPVVTIATNGAQSPGSPAINSTKNIIYSFTAAPTTANATLTGFNFTTTGTITSTDITQYQLWYNPSLSNFTDAGTVAIGSVSGIGNATSTAFASFVSKTITNGATGYFWITTDVSTNAVAGHTVTVSALNSGGSNFTIASATYTAGTITAGGLQTISCTPPAPTSPAAGTTNICTGNAATITFTAGSLASGTYTVTYNVSAPNTSTGNTASMSFSGGTGTFSTPVLNSAGSNIVTITAIALSATPGCTVTLSTATPSFTTITAPVFTTNPTGTSSVCVGGSGTTLTVAVTGSGITQYQWFSNTSAVNSGGTVVATHSSASTSDTYTTSTASASALYYYCIVTTSAGSCNTATSSVSGLFTVTTASTANAGNPLSGICQGSSAITIGGGASSTGGTSAVWTDGGVGGTFTNNALATITATTWAPPAAYAGTVTFTLTTSGGCSTATGTKTLSVLGIPSFYNPPATANYIRYDFTNGSPLVNQGNVGGPAVLGTGTGGSIVQTTDRFGNANSAYSLTPGTGGNYWISNTSAITLTYVPMTEGVWFKTTVAGGTLLGVNSDAAGANGNPDHNLYMDDAGKIVFDIYNGSVHVAVTSPAAYNDGKWHQVTVTTTTTAPQTITLYVDGASVASTSSTLGLTSAGSRFLLSGVNNLTFSLADKPTNWAFTGSIDDIIIYNGTTLTSTQIANMYDVPTVTASSSCSSGTTVTLSSRSLLTGTYTVTYSVSGANTITAATTNMSFTAGTPGTGTFTLSLPNAGSNVVNVTSLVLSSGSCSTTLNLNLSTSSFTSSGNMWNGSVNTSWNNVSNWCGGSVPTAPTNFTIPVITVTGTNGLINYPTIASNTSGAIKNLTVASGANVTVNGTLIITGSISGTNAIDATNGTVEMAGSAAQSITGSNFVNQTVYSLMDSTTSGGLSLDSLSITGELGFPYAGTSSLAISKNLVLVSNATTTAWVGPITEVSGVPQATITGKVIVQRYFPSHRRWRFITAPVTTGSAQTINAAWQEGVVSTTTPLSNPNPLPGYGTHITGPSRAAYAPGLGYDQSPTNGASIAYVHDTSSWFILPNTNVTKVTDKQGYMIFVRGARDYSISTTSQYITATTATLRTTGTLKTGVQNIPVIAGANVIGNPYAATINFNTIFNKSATQTALGSATANNTFYLWDPNIASAANIATGTGGWVVLTSNGSGSYIPVPDPRSISPFNVNGDIQPGAAFIVHAQGSGVVQIDESDKVSPAVTNNDLYLFRPSNAAPVTMLRTTLYATAADTVNYLADGVLNMFDNSFSNEVDWNKDIQKQANMNEQCAISKGGHLLAVQRRSAANIGDTIFLQLGRLNQRSYRFSFEATNFNRTDINAYLIDTFMHTSTRVALKDSTTNSDFVVTASSGSAAAGRFAITFRPAPGKATYKAITATQQGRNVLVQWTVSEELNVVRYIIERSADGISFYPVDTTTATSAGTTGNGYDWLDIHPVTGINYYRIRNINTDGGFQESNTVNVTIGKGIISGIAIYPNPVINGVINLQMNNVPAGNYGINVIDATGHIILTETIAHGTVSETKSIFLNQDAAKGIYILEVQFPDKTYPKIKFVNQ